MPRRKLTSAEANRAIGLLQGGQRQSDVATFFQVSQSVISRLFNRFQETGSVEERPRIGRPSITTPAEDRYVTISARREPLSTCRMLSRRLAEATGTAISAETVRRRLWDVNLRSRRLFRGVPLTREHRRQRLEWARERVNWTEEWKLVLFTDESRYGRFSDSRRKRVWTQPLVPRHRRLVQEVHPFRGGTVCVWGGICYDGRTDLLVIPGNMNSEVYLNQVINNIVPEFHAAVGPGFLFLDDNARPHRSMAVMDAIETNGIPHLALPALSPDLNPIEHAWDQLQKALDHHNPQPQTMEQVRNLLPQLWHQIPQENFNNLITSMQRRCQAVIEAHGGHTRYC